MSGNLVFPLRAAPVQVCPWEAGVGVKLPPPPRLSWLPGREAWGSVPTTGGRRAQGEGLPVALVSVAPGEDVGMGSKDRGTWVDE